MAIPIKCSDIDDKAVLCFLAEHQGHWSTHGKSLYMPTVQDAMPPGTPVKLQLAKMKQLHHRRLVGGCTCGCRGDWEITDKGLAVIGKERKERTTAY